MEVYSHIKYNNKYFKIFVYILYIFNKVALWSNFSRWREDVRSIPEGKEKLKNSSVKYVLFALPYSAWSQMFQILKEYSYIGYRNVISVRGLNFHFYARILKNAHSITFTLTKLIELLIDIFIFRYALLAERVGEHQYSADCQVKKL